MLTRMRKRVVSKADRKVSDGREGKRRQKLLEAGSGKWEVGRWEVMVMMM